MVDNDVTERVLRDHKSLIEEEEVETRPEKLADGLIDENVDINLVRRFFTADAWLLVEQSMECMKKSRRYVCEVCFRDLDEQESIACDLCLKWAHLACVGLTKSPKRKYWYCRKCHQ